MAPALWLERLAYIILIVVTAMFWIAADNIEFAERPGTLGPAFWPKLALGLIVLVSIVEIARSFLVRAASTDDADLPDPNLDESEQEGDRRPALLIGGVILTVAYGVLIPILGFVVGTFLFLVLFMYLGQYRNHLAIWVTALVGTSVFALLFLRVIYVSLPRGIAPFDKAADFFINLF